MLAYLSGEWLAALQAAADADDSLRVASRETSLSVEQHVIGGPTGDVVFHVVFDHGKVHIGEGAVDDPDVTLTQPYDVAAGVAQGTRSAQAASLVGALTVTGRMERLQAQAGVLDRVDDVFRSVRSQTEY